MTEDPSAAEPADSRVVEPVDSAVVEPADSAVVEPVETPFLRVVRGDATAEEVAALVAVLGSMGGGEATPRRPAPAWAAHHRKVRVTLPHGPGGWRSSALPR